MGGESAVQLALGLTTWSSDIVLCTDGWTRVTAAQSASLRAHGIQIRSERVAAFEGTGGQLERIRFRSGESLARDAAFFHARCRPRSPLAEKLGCRLTRSTRRPAS